MYAMQQKYIYMQQKKYICNKNIYIQQNICICYATKNLYMQEKTHIQEKIYMLGKSIFKVFRQTRSGLCFSTSIE